MFSAPLSIAFIGQVCLIADNTERISRSKSSFSENPSELKYCQDATVPDDYTIVKGVGAYKIHTEALNWNDARKACEAEGAHLVIINSKKEAEVVRNIIANAGEVTNYKPNNDYSWSGFHSLYEDDDYVSLNGGKVADSGYNVWAEGEPNNEAGREQCGSLLNEDAKLNDATCADRHSYVCEFGNLYVNWV